MKALIPIWLIGILISCESRNTISVNIKAKNNEIDSIYIVESITQKILARLATGDQILHEQIDLPTIATIQTKDSKQSFLTLLHPNKVLNVKIGPDSSIHTNNLADSLLNYLWKSNNDFIGENAGFIFSSDQADSILKLFKNFEVSRRLEIENRASKLSSDDKEFLLYQNSARIHSFLFYYARMLKKFPAQHEFFSFTESIQNNNKWTKTLPQNLLYKHEINYLLTNDSIKSIESYMDYVTSKTDNKDLLAFLKAAYINDIIETPSYWPHHERHLTPEILQLIIDREKSNKYYDLIVRSANSFFSSQKGQKAFNFEAEKIDGSKVQLSDFNGKIVFIDTWASYCGPCIAHRPKVLELAKKYQSNNRVQILMISVDADKDDWMRYLTKTEQLNNDEDLIVVGGMNGEYSDRFNVKQIPKYILIDENGVIINSDIPEPSAAVEEMIEYYITQL